MAELSTLARPYARAAFEYADAKGELKGWSSMLALLAEVTEQEALVRLLASPNYTPRQQAEKLISVCGDELSTSVQNYVGVLAENRRLPLLQQIQQQFEVLKANREKSVDVTIESAIELTAELREKLSKALSARLEREVNMQVNVDKSLIGGAVVRAGDTVIDGSIRGRLAKLAEALNS